MVDLRQIDVDKIVGDGDSDDAAGIPSSPTEKIDFGVYGDSDSFTPLYYPSRFNITTEKEFERSEAGCSGEKISIKKLKNSEMHVTGKAHAPDLRDLHKLARSNKPVEVITPVIQGGGMEVYVKKVERGELIGWDGFPKAEEWMFEYTIDLVSTGKDEYDTGGGSTISTTDGESNSGTPDFNSEDALRGI